MSRRAVSEELSPYNPLITVDSFLTGEGTNTEVRDEMTERRSVVVFRLDSRQEVTSVDQDRLTG